MLPKYLDESNYDATKAFEKMHGDLESAEFDTSCSGTTCVVVLIDECNRLQVGLFQACVAGVVGNVLCFDVDSFLCIFFPGKVASVGDSRAVLAVRNSTSYMPVKLNPDHKPGDPLELKRIKAAGGSVSVRHKGGDPLSFPDGGPLRVWSRTEKGTFSGLCMSRSLGDALAHKEGVIHLPFRDMYPLEEGDDFVIIGSDGIWDVLSKATVLGIANECIMKGRRSASGSWGPQEVAEMIATVARKKWEEGSSGRIDDITCLVVKLSHG
mmetsp:Transcript_35790/g.106822  ORF Transcript_35790/g.106822 Transcript_35790/m.106822 type:complete len:267 (-) Transcript_35790:14-814(-)